jgi:hypothetical protein
VRPFNFTSAGNDNRYADLFINEKLYFMKRRSFGKACLALLFCIVQLNAIYANNGGTQAAAPAPAPKTSTWAVSMQSLKMFDKFHAILEKISKQPPIAGANAANSTITNFRPGNKTLEFPSLQFEYNDGTPDYWTFANSLLQYGQSASFTVPDLTNVWRISLFHLGESFPCEEYGIIKTNNGTITYTGMASCVERIEWCDCAGQTNGAMNITNGMTISVY